MNIIENTYNVSFKIKNYMFDCRFVCPSAIFYNIFLSFYKKKQSNTSEV